MRAHGMAPLVRILKILITGILKKNEPCKNSEVLNLISFAKKMSLF
jgi:hypothetical protein